MSLHQHGSITVMLVDDKEDYRCPICAMREEIDTLKQILEAEREENKRLNETVRDLSRKLCARIEGQERIVNITNVSNANELGDLQRRYHDAMRTLLWRWKI